MDFNKAIRILGLTSNFTEEELRKAYRIQITKYHPDKYVSKSEREKKEAEERSKEINVAKEYLENYLKGNTRNRKQHNNTYKPDETVELMLRKVKFKNVLNNMKLELSSIPNIIFDDMLKETRDYIMYLIKTLETQINLIYTLQALETIEKTYYNRIRIRLDQYETNYCKKYNITIGNKILERYSLKKLYEQLEQIKKEQNGYSIEELLEKELNKYVYYSGYIVIKKLIQNIIEDFISFHNTKEEKEKIINRFNKRVLNEFKEYYKRLEVLNTFKQMNLTKPKLKRLLASLEANIANPETFKYFEEQMINALADLSILEITEEPKIYNNKEIYNNIKKENLYITKDYNIKKKII